MSSDLSLPPLSSPLSIVEVAKAFPVRDENEMKELSSETVAKIVRWQYEHQISLRLTEEFKDPRLLNIVLEGAKAVPLKK